MIFFAFWLIGLVLIIVQSAILPLFLSPFYVPNLFFIFISYLAYRFSWKRGLFLAFILAWLFDTVVAAELGFYPVEALILFSFFKFIMTNASVQIIFYQLPLVGASYFLCRLAEKALYSFLGLSYFSGGVVSGTILVLLAAMPLFFLLDLLYKNIEKRQGWRRNSRRGGSPRVW